MVLDVLPDEELMLKLEDERKGKRDDYPIRAVWNSIIAGVVFQHKSIESLRRELLWNGELRAVCGFDPIRGGEAVPSKDAYSEMLKKLLRHQIIDIRNVWKDGEETRALCGDIVDNIVYDSKGCIYCYDVITGEKREMAYGGFEKYRECLKYLCPAMRYGIECQGRDECGGKGYGRIVRVDMEIEKRLFTPIARNSYKWERIYKGRTAVKRVNSRWDGGFGFEDHFIRGRQR